jgi:hypothetical protein
MTYAFKSILSRGSPKADKAVAHGALMRIAYLAPHDLAGVGNLCPHASAGCRALCLGWHSGQAAMIAGGSQSTAINPARQARLDRARLFMADRAGFVARLDRELSAHLRTAEKQNLEPVARLNGSADINWLGVRDRAGRTVYERHRRIQFVEYTKSHAMMTAKRPPNLALVFSLSEWNHATAGHLLRRGESIALVADFAPPSHWHGYTIIDGDQHDLRHRDPHNCIVWLSPKGTAAKNDRSGFVLRSIRDLESIIN